MSSYNNPNNYNNFQSYNYYNSYQHPNHYPSINTPIQNHTYTQKKYQHSLNNQDKHHHQRIYNDPRNHTKDINRNYTHFNKEKYQKTQSNNHYQHKQKKQQRDQSPDPSLNSQQSDQSSDCQIQYQINRANMWTQNKPVKDPVMDSPQEIKKWLAARKKNYPKRINNLEEKPDKEISLKELSKLQIKLRKQIRFINSNPRTVEQRAKQLDILKSVMTDSHRHKRIQKNIKKPLVTKPKPRKVREQARSQDDDKQQVEQNQDVIQQKVMRTQMQLQAPQNNKALESLIESLKGKRDTLNQHVSKMLDYKSNSANYKHIEKILLTNMVIQDVFKQSCYLLQAIRFIVSNNFLQQGQLYDVVVSEQSQKEEEQVKINQKPLPKQQPRKSCTKQKPLKTIQTNNNKVEIRKQDLQNEESLQEGEIL